MSGCDILYVTLHKDQPLRLRFSGTSSKYLFIFFLLDFDFISVLRPAEDLSREVKSSTDGNHNTTSAVMTPSSHGPGKIAAQLVTSSSPATSSNSVLSNFLYGMPMSSKPHPDSKLDFKPMSFLNLGKDRLANWTAGTDKNMSVKDCANNGKVCMCGLECGFQQWNMIRRLARYLYPSNVSSEYFLS